MIIKIPRRVTILIHFFVVLFQCGICECDESYDGLECERNCANISAPRNASCDSSAGIVCK